MASNADMPAEAHPPGVSNGDAQASGAPKPRVLTSEEAAVYDRQIRLWGLEAQQRLSAARLLLVGTLPSHLGAELAKNLVLAGIARLTLCPFPSSAASTPSFLGATPDAFVAALSEMNPHVAVEVLPPSPTTPALADYAAVCALELGARYEAVLADASRAAGVPFFSGRTAGLYGGLFVDAGDWTCAGDRATAAGAQAAAEGGSAAAPAAPPTTISTSFPAHAVAREVKAAEAVVGWGVMATLGELADAVAGGDAHGKTGGDSRAAVWPAKDAPAVGTPEGTRPTPPSFSDVWARRGGQPGGGGRGRRDEAGLVEAVGRTAGVSLPAVAACLGGVWGREVIKVASGVGVPLRNFFWFDGRTGAGVVEVIG
ncbi:hypothetical protein MMPV_004457 [Pyropia vietnamensis]